VRSPYRDTLHALDRHRPLTVQLRRVPLVALLLAVLQPLALVIFQKAVLATKVSGAEAAVANDALCRVLAFLEAAADLLRRHAPAHGQRHVQRCVGRDVQVGQRRQGRREVLAGVHEAQVGRGDVVTEREERGEGVY
jgi:hypothetical protein